MPLLGREETEVVVRLSPAMGGSPL